jgi:hypothetical protein
VAVNANKVESYLQTLGFDYSEVGEHTWLIDDRDKGLQNVVVMAEEPVVVVRVKVMESPTGKERSALYEELLRLNATDLVHGAYALDGEDVVLQNTLRTDTMDLEELQATLDAIGLALAQHYQRLSRYRRAATKKEG